MDKCAECGSVSFTVAELIEGLQDWEPKLACLAVFWGNDFAHEGLRCNIEHGPGEDHGHKMERIIYWPNVSAQD